MFSRPLNLMKRMKLEYPITKGLTCPFPLRFKISPAPKHFRQTVNPSSPRDKIANIPVSFPHIYVVAQNYSFSAVEDGLTYEDKELYRPLPPHPPSKKSVGSWQTENHFGIHSALYHLIRLQRCHSNPLGGVSGAVPLSVD